MLGTSWELWTERIGYFVTIDLLACRPSHVVSQDDIVTWSTGYNIETIMSAMSDTNTAKMNLLPIIPLCDCR